MTREVDPQIKSLVAAKSAPAVQKAQLAVLRSRFPDRIVFVFEGIDDKTVYREWVRRANPALSYEPFLCENKNFLLQLMDVLERDRGGIGHGVFFFVDKDFDDLRGRSRTPAIFVTDAYAIENYLVDERVLDELLVINFHCHAQPLLRAAIVERFGKVYNKFLSETRSVNLRLFTARKCGIHQLGKLPERISQIASITLNDVVLTDAAVNEIVVLQREPSTEESEQWRADFDRLDPRAHYRGKFALLFFKKWLNLLLAERTAPDSSWFGELAGDGMTPHGYFEIEVLATKSRLPEGFEEFLRYAAASHRVH